MMVATLENRVSDVLSAFGDQTLSTTGHIARHVDGPVLATPFALAGAFAGGAAYGGALVAAFEAGRAVRGGR